MRKHFALCSLILSITCGKSFAIVYLFEPALTSGTVTFNDTLSGGTSTSVGAGALGVTALLILYPKAPITKIVGSDVAHAVPLTLVAGLGHVTLGTIDYNLLGTLLIGSIPGIWIGSHLSSRVAEHWVRTVLALILVYVGQKLAFPQFNQLLGISVLLFIIALKQLGFKKS